MLVEACCYLLNLKQPSPSSINPGQQSHERLARFSEEELINPFLTIQYFFEVYSLPEWKRMMHFLWRRRGFRSVVLLRMLIRAFASLL